MTKPDLQNMDLEELLKMEQTVQAQIARKRDAKRKEILQQISDLVRQYNLTYDEVVRSIRNTAKRGKAPAMYRNPTNPRQTWSGKGNPPQWYKQAPDPEALRIS